MGRQQLEASHIANITKVANSQRISLYSESTCIDGELKLLLAQKKGLELDFDTIQKGMKLKRDVWEKYRLTLLRLGILRLPI